MHHIPQKEYTRTFLENNRRKLPCTYHFIAPNSTFCVWYSCSLYIMMRHTCGEKQKFSFIHLTPERKVNISSFNFNYIYTEREFSLLVCTALGQLFFVFYMGMCSHSFAVGIFQRWFNIRRGLFAKFSR